MHSGVTIKPRHTKFGAYGLLDALYQPAIPDSVAGACRHRPRLIFLLVSFFLKLISFCLVLYSKIVINIVCPLHKKAKVLVLRSRLRSEINIV